ncbi:MAG: glucose-1-phosphate thymidylyltransferase [Methanotrichaceae archaeon]|nr:glucose-1-phosphate thymidylyltransferase [Methanotrichaceae archaeon]
MKGLVLSGGYGTRLRPLTYSQQKQLIPVANKPILFYAIDDIIEAGVFEIGIIVGPNRDQVERTVKSREWDADIRFIYQDAPRGLAHTVLISEEFIGCEPFVMYLGDNLLCDGIVDHANSFRSSGADASILLTEVSHPERFGVAELNECGEVVRLVEKPRDPPSNLALVGVYLFQPVIFEAVKNIRPSWRNELEITDAIQWLVENGYHVQASVVKGWWKDTGMPEDILSANNLILDELEASCSGNVADGSEVQGRVSIGPGTVLAEGSVVRGPVIMGRDCKISNSYIGPYTSIGDGCVVVDSEIEGSIVMDGTKINVRHKIVDSLIGANVNISESCRKPKGYRFVVGDNSEVQV